MPKHKKHSRTHNVKPQSALPLRVLAGGAIIVVAAFLAYFPTVNAGFIMDDDELLTNNNIVMASDGLYRFWCTAEATDYWPVTNTTFWIEWRLWGMNAAGYHVTNLILHVFEALLIWLILRKLSIPGAFLAALVFAVHPVNVESVAWISQRKNMMAMLFFLLSILCYIKYSLYHSHASLYWLSFAAFILAMLSKGSVAVLPVLILGILWWQRTMATAANVEPANVAMPPSITWRKLLRTAPFFLVAVLLTLVNMWFQTHGSGKDIRAAGVTERLLGAGCVVWFYLYKALLPLNLAYVYQQWRINVGNPLWWLPLLAVLLVTAVLWRYRKSWSRPFLFAWGFFCVALTPVMGFTDVFFMRYSLVADHYQHVAIIGLIALASAGLYSWTQRLHGTRQWTAKFVALLAIIVLAFLTWRQSGLYRGPFTLFRDTLEKNPDCWMARNNYGKALFEAGRLHDAIEQFRLALALKSDYTEAYNNIGGTLVQINRPEEAIGYIQQALLLKPDYPEAHNNMGNYFFKTNRPLEAIEYYRIALRLKPDFPEAHKNMGLALVLAGQRNEAIQHFRQALVLKPNYLDAQYNLGNTLLEMGRPQDALAHFAKVLLGKPDYPEAYNNLGIALIQLGRSDEAIESYKKALLLKPDYAEAYVNLGNALVQVGRSQEAIKNCEQALLLKPDDFKAHYNLGNALVQSNRPQEAVAHFQQAIRLNPDYPDALNNLGLALVRSGRPEEAIEPCQKALQLNPDFTTAYVNLAVAYAKINQSTRAVAAAQKALDLARSQGQTALVVQIQEWLNSYQGQGTSGEQKVKNE